MCLAGPLQVAAKTIVQETKPETTHDTKDASEQEVVVIRNTFFTVVRVPTSIRCTSAPPCLGKGPEIPEVPESKSKPDAKRRGRRRAHRAKRGTDIMLPSRGSRNHFRGLCRPCKFSPEECPDGEMCNFCHHSHGSGETTPRSETVESSTSTDVASPGLAFSNHPLRGMWCETKCADGCWRCLNCSEGLPC